MCDSSTKGLYGLEWSSGGRAQGLQQQSFTKPFYHAKGKEGNMRLLESCKSVFDNIEFIIFVSGVRDSSPGLHTCFMGFTTPLN